ncbi:ubiquitin-conjugating enzyme E2 S [Phakopsora pachyrhizi]|uniref:E2 ubiquitin-conjugating enzyme n=1 Tax=Phakopsora pachyrhizi TaxID=170000 RepID=A0AAV0BF06_PHAPC|nr:ubiquitin-conjugating enzyme E2 S [Phakopsora pachyrhizi]
MSDCLSSKVLRRIGKETNSLRLDPPEGIRIVINEDDITDVKAWIQGPTGTPYDNGFFKILIKFGPEYPSLPPVCTFSTKIFHPNVGPQGEICVNTLKKDWSSSQTISEILTVIKCLLIYPNPESALDEEAGKMLLERYEEYRQRAKLWTDIHARNRPVEFQSTSNNETNHSSERLLPNQLCKSPTQPFGSSNQVNNPILLDPSSTSNCDEFDKSNSIVRPQGENRVSSATAQAAQTVPSKTKAVSQAKEKDRRGRKRL